MKWTLELRDTLGRGPAEWKVWVRGTLEECLADLMLWRAGKFTDAYDAARLVTEREQ
jgi:hypothetical protein